MFEIPKYKVERPVYSLDDLSQDYVEEDVKSNIFKCLNCQRKIGRLTIWSIMRVVFPLPFILASFYSWKYIIYDIFAGLTLLSFHIPQGMAYGLLAGLQPINGLYASFFPVIIYSFFGTSRNLSLGTFAVMSLLANYPIMREASIERNNMHNKTGNISFSEENFKLQISIAMILLAGMIQFIMGVLQLGCIMNYINNALISGFLSAVGLHIILSQFDQILGYTNIHIYTGLGQFPYKLYLISSNFKDIHWVTFGVSCGSIFILVIFTELIAPRLKKLVDIPIPIQLIIIIISAIMSYYLKFSFFYSVRIVGNIPHGLPAPLVPDIFLWPRIIGDAFLIAIFAFILNCAVVKSYAIEYDYDINFNQELVAYGLSTIFSSFFRCIMSSGSLSRTAVASQVGIKSQLASLISCFFMMFVLLFVGPLFKHLPLCVLSSIVVVSLKSTVFQIKEVPDLYKLSKYDFDIWMVAFLGTLFLNIPIGLAVGFVFSLVTIFIRFHNPKYEIVGQLPKTNIYKDIKTHRDAVEIPGVKIFRYYAPIYFANVDHFERKLVKNCQINNHFHLSNEKLKGHNDSSDINDLTKYEELKNETKFIIIDFASINYVDKVAVKTLERIYNQLRKVGIAVFLAEPNLKIRKMLSKSNFATDNLNTIIFVSIHDAVLRSLTIKMGFMNL